MAVIGITDGSEVTVSEPSRIVTIEEAEQIATASYASFTAKDYEQLANKPSIEGVTLVGDTELSEIGAAAADHTHSLESLGAAAADHTHSLESLGAAAADHSHTLESLGAAAANHSHSLESLGAAAADHTHTPSSIGAAEADHTHTPESIGAAAASHTHAASSITGLGSAALMDDDDFDAAGAAAAVLGTAQDAAGDATVYGALASAAAVEDELVHHTHTPAEIGAAPAVHTHTPASIGAAAESHEHDAADITSGVLDDELIPNLDASKITSGTFDGGRLPTVPITKGGTGATDAAAARTALGAAAANHTHTAADVGAADAVHSHAATDIASGTLASDRLPTVPVSKGGTGATTAAAARTALGIGGSQLNGTQIGGINSNRQAVEVTNSGQNMCALVLKRGEMTMSIVLVDLWSANLAVWGTLPADLHFIRPSTSGNTNKFTIQNNLSISGSAIAMVGIGCTFGTVTETEAAIAENFTRTVMDDFVPSTGGAFTGNVVHEGGNIYVDDTTLVSGTTPSSNQFGKAIYFRDSGNVDLGAINAAIYTSGKQGLRVFAKRTVGSTTYNNELNLTIDASGNRSVWVSEAAAWLSGIGAAAANHTHSYLPLSGGTLTGDELVKSSNMETGTTPSSNQYGKGVRLVDKNDSLMGLIRMQQRTSGTDRIEILVRKTVNGTNHDHGLYFGIDGNNDPIVEVTDAAAWRNGIGAAASSHTHSADDVASGTLATARLPTVTASKGGTGRTTLTSNAVLAGNGTGQVKQIATASGALYATAANGAAQFGALPVAQGGTGATSASAARTALGIGEQLDDVVIADISLPSSNQTTILGTMTIPAGKWLLKGVAYFAANSSGDRKVYLGTGTSYANQRGCAVSAAPGSQVCIIEVMPIMTFTKNTVVNLIPYQSSGSALSTRGMISAVRLA